MEDKTKLEIIGHEVSLLDSYFKEDIPHVFERQVLMEFYQIVKKLIVDGEV